MPRHAKPAANKSLSNAAKQRAYRLRKAKAFEQAQLDAQLNVFQSPRSLSLPPSSPSSKPSSIAPTLNLSPIKLHSSILDLEEHSFFDHSKQASIIFPRSSRDHLPGSSQDKTSFSDPSTLPFQFADVDKGLNFDDEHASHPHDTANSNASELQTESSGWIGEAIDQYEESSDTRKQKIRQQQQETNLRLEQWAKELPEDGSPSISSPARTPDGSFVSAFPKVIIPIPVLSNSHKYLRYPDENNTDLNDTNDNTDIEHATHDINKDHDIYYATDEPDGNETEHDSVSSKSSNRTVVQAPVIRRRSVRHPPRLLEEYEEDYEGNIRLAQRVLERSWAPKCQCG